MSQQEFDYPESQHETQRSELAYYEQRGTLMDEVPFGKQYDTLPSYHLAGEKLVPGRSRQFALWNPVVFFSLALFMVGILFGFTLLAMSPVLHSLSFSQMGNQANLAPVVNSVPSGKAQTSM